MDHKSEIGTHLKISCNVEGHSSRGVDDIKNREVEAKGQYSRAENDDEGRKERGACKKPLHDPRPFQHHGWHSQDHSCKRSHVINCVYAAVSSKTINSLFSEYKRKCRCQGKKKNELVTASKFPISINSL